MLDVIEGDSQYMSWLTTFVNESMITHTHSLTHLLTHSLTHSLTQIQEDMHTVRQDRDNETDTNTQTASDEIGR